MWVNKQKQFAFNFSFYCILPGDFGIPFRKNPKSPLVDMTIDRWVSCRDSFQRYYSRRKTFLFKCGQKADSKPSTGKLISKFFDKLENILKLEESERARFGPTNNPGIIWIETSNWWRADKMRRSLFTALVRQAVHYEGTSRKNNFRDVLYNGRYTVQTPDALKLFLKGNTHYWGKSGNNWNCGWVSTFRGKGMKDIVETLKDHKRLKNSK